MKIILTGPQGNLGYWDAKARVVGQHAFGFMGHFKNADYCVFARGTLFADNRNYAPMGCDGAVTCDLGLDMLYAIAGAK